MQLGTINLVILAAYLAAMLAIGWRFAGRQKTSEDFFLAGRRMPWLAVAMSMYASVTSAVTFMGLPGRAYAENISLIVVCIVSPLLAPVLIGLFYPVYRRLNVTTSYEYILKRFGPRARWCVSGLFILARLGWMGTVVFAPAMALSVATGLPMWATILMMGVLATAYTALGGMSAVIWTDVVQFVIMVGGAVWVALALTAKVPGGIPEIVGLAREHNHLLGAWRPSLTQMSVLVVSLTFFLQLMQDYGTDQVTVQRLMAVNNPRGVTKAILFNAGTDFLVVGLLLFIGLGLFAYFQHFPERLTAGLRADSVFPFFIVHALPTGVSGLLLAAIFAAAMSSMDSGINSLATVVVHDFVKPLRASPPAELKQVNLARLLTVGFGGAATAVAFVVSRMGNIIEAYTSIVSLFSAPVLALFLLGMLTKRGSFGGWLAGCAVSVIATLALQRFTSVHWVYYFPFSFVLCYGVGYPASLVTPQRVTSSPRSRTT